ncbi:hypothetical protein K1T71_007731 [Dendrolimus kikuchii]|uniref:Uncharacterized protein n=1 Tax=Dendrolimus kikuchii TaxID=765133 RepID=A0ACC1CY79_9NEOP|nr:hypothetical protein K1T71_007731 [Dendrolimus kikuchii]
MLSITFFLYLILISETIVSKKIQLPDLDSSRSKPQGECSRCKILADSFNNWLGKTSRGKYEGGDAAWEEAKLKSYSRSEIRLVEIQESLCSEIKQHKDECYILAEEVEPVLEKWWFNEDPISTDLYTWLCIETLQYCCPALHYGDACYPCPISKDNKICSGHGKCNGEGTRKGNGTCICNRGYIGSNCDECAKNYFLHLDSCESCHKSCNGCTGEGAYSCLTCKNGWELKTGQCVDIDECLTPSSCKQNQYCVNQEGSYICKSCDKSCSSCAGKGPTNCTSCEGEYLLWSGVLILYCGLLIIAFIIFRTSRKLASVVILIIAIYIYFYEKESSMNCIDALQNFYFIM